MVFESTGYSKFDGRCVRIFRAVCVRFYANLESSFRGDLHDLILYTTVPHLTFSTPYSYSILALTVVTFFMLLIALPMIPLRPVFLVLGLTPFALTHPFTLAYLPVLLSPYTKRIRMKVTRLVDDDRLEDHHLKSVLKEVELWENERLGPGPSGTAVFSKAHLRSYERKGWTRGRDGWSNTGPDGNGDVRFVLFAAPLLDRGDYLDRAC